MVTAFFDNLFIDNFMGFVIKESTSKQIKDTLSAKGISFREYPDNINKNEKMIVFPYESGDLIWDCNVIVKDDVLTFVRIYKYCSDSYNIYKNLCREMTKRYGSSYIINNRQDKYDGTETTSFEKKLDNAWLIIEFVYDSSPILGQKNIYIKCFKV